MESVLISRFTMNNIAPKLQKCWTHKIAFKIVQKNAQTTKFLLELAFYIFEGHTCKVLSFYDVWFTFNDKLCSPYPTVNFLRIFNNQNRKRNLKGYFSLNDFYAWSTCKIQRNDYRHGSCGPTLTGKTSSVSLIFTHGTHRNVKNC